MLMYFVVPTYINYLNNQSIYLTSSRQVINFFQPRNLKQYSELIDYKTFLCLLILNTKCFKKILITN